MPIPVQGRFQPLFVEVAEGSPALLTPRFFHLPTFLHAPGGFPAFSRFNPFWTVALEPFPGLWGAPRRPALVVAGEDPRVQYPLLFPLGWPFF